MVNSLTQFTIGAQRMQVNIKTLIDDAQSAPQRSVRHNWEVYYMNKKIFVIFSLLVLAFLGLSGLTAADSLESPAPYCVGKWLPSDQLFLEQWMGKLAEGTESVKEPLLPVILKFKEIIEEDPQLYMLFSQMFDQVPNNNSFSKDPTGKPQIRNYRQMLRVMNQILSTAPEFNRTGLVGFPINAVINWPMGTPAGTTVFLNEKVNRQLKKILNQWAVFLSSADSRYVLNDDPEKGWFGRDAKAAMPLFLEDFICDPVLPYYGFSSWDDFFTFYARVQNYRPLFERAFVSRLWDNRPYSSAQNPVYAFPGAKRQADCALADMIIPWVDAYQG